MGQVTATPNFDEENLDKEVAEDLVPLTEWLNENFQNLVNLMQGQIGDKNLTTKMIEVKASNGRVGEYAINGRVSHVQPSRVSSQSDSGITITGFNWWPSTNGFKYVVTFSSDIKERDFFMRVDFNV